MSGELTVQSWRLNTLTLHEGRYYSDPEKLIESDWQLAAGHFQPSIHTLAIGYPRTDAEAWAYHKRAPSGYDRHIQIVPLGGSPPWYVVVTDDAGQTVSVDNDPDSDTYLRLSITDVQITSGTLAFELWDQEGESVTYSHAFAGIDRDNTTYFVHLTEGAGGTEAGTSTNPIRSLGTLLGPTTGSTTWQGRQVIVTGTFDLSAARATLPGLYGSNGTKLQVNSNKPQVWVASTIGGATFQGSAANVDGANINCSSTNFTAVGFNWENPYMDEVLGGEPPSEGLRNVFVHGSSSAYARGGFFFNDFDASGAQEDGADGGSNPAAIFYSSGGTGGHTAIAGNTFRNFVYMLPVQFFDANDQYIFGNTYRDSSVAEGFYLKGGTSLRRYAFYWNKAITNVTGPFSFIDSINGPSPWLRQEIEFMHNTYKGTNMVHLGGANEDSVYDVHVVRNSFKGANILLIEEVKEGDTVVNAYNLIEHSAGTEGVTLSNAAVVPDSNNNTHGASGIVDDTTLEPDGGRDGIHGAGTA